MALTKKTIELPLIGGLDTKTDDKQLKLGKLTTAQNISYRKPGKIIKRDGFQSLGNTIADTGALLTDGQAAMTYKGELLAFDKNNVYSYVSSTNNWKDKGDFQSIYLTQNPVSNGVSREYMEDVAVSSNGIELYVFMRSVGSTRTMYYQAVDTATKQLIVGPVAVGLPNGTILPRVIAHESQFILFYFDTNDNRIYRGLLPFGNVLQTITFDAITDNDANAYSPNATKPTYDVLAYKSKETGQTYHYLAFANASAAYGGNGAISILWFLNAADTSVAGLYESVLDEPVHITLTTNENTFPASNIDLIYVVATSAAPANISNAYMFAYTYDVATELLNTSANITTLTGLTNTITCKHITAVSVPNDTNSVLLYVAVDFVYGAGVQVYTTGFIWDVGTNTLSETLFTKGQTSLVCNAFIYAGKPYVGIVAGSTLTNPAIETTYFLLDNKGEAIARYNYQVAGFLDAESFTPTNPSWAIWYLPHTNAISDTAFITALKELTATVQVDGEYRTGIRSTTYDFYEPEKSYSRRQIGESLYVGGGMLFQYDGQNLVEDGFNWRPRIIGSGTPLGTGFTYRYVAVWEWTDNNGYTHISAPSDPITITIGTAIGAGGSANISAYPLTLTLKAPANNRTNAKCVLYRTKANLEGYFRLQNIVSNDTDPATLFLVFATDTTLDAALTIPLYADSEQPNSVAPPVGGMVVWKNRLWIIDSTNPLVLYYSKVANIDRPVEWAGLQRVFLDPSGGDCTALGALDDKLIIFKNSNIRYLVGDGPDATGNNDDFTGTTLITTDAGCTNARSVVLTPDGLIFKSAKGIYFINRGLQVSYIGAPVERWNDAFITSAVLMAKNNQVRLTLDNSSFLVYDYFVDAWSTFTTLNAVDSVIWNNQHAFIGSVGKLFVETPDTYTDDGASYPMEIETGWINLGGIQGYMRLWNIMLLGQFLSPHKLNCSLAYNYNNATYQNIVIDPVASSFYGSGPYGLETPYGGEFTPYQYEIRPEWEKCNAFRLKINDTISGSTPLEEAYELSNIRLSYGVIGGSNRLKNQAIFG